MLLPPNEVERDARFSIGEWIAGVLAMLSPVLGMLAVSLAASCCCCGCKSSDAVHGDPAESVEVSVEDAQFPVINKWWK